MSDLCQFDGNCQETPAYECPCKETPLLLCKKHLDMHIFTPSNKGHNIRPISVPAPQDAKNKILQEILKLKLSLHKEQEKYSKQVQALIEKVYAKHAKGLKKFQELSQKLDRLLELVKKVTDIKTNRVNPPIFNLYQYSLEVIPYKFEDMHLIAIEYKGIMQKTSLKITEFISLNFPDLTGEPVSLTQAKCLRGHFLLYSFDSEAFYTYVNHGKSNRNCDYCKSLMEKDSLHCRICMFDVCDPCSKAKKYILPELLTCPNKHNLGWVPQISALRVTSVNCDICRINYRSSGWRCHICDYDMCIGCGQQKGIQTPFTYPIKCNNSHDLICVDPEGKYCTICKEIIRNVHWDCKSCTYSLCGQCSGMAGFKVPKCNYKHFMTTYQKSIGKIWKFRLADKCSGCDRKVGPGDWMCTECNSYICVDCLNENPILYLLY